MTKRAPVRWAAASALHAGARLRLLLDRLAYSDAARPPTRLRLAEALQEGNAHLGRDLASLNRITAKVTGRSGSRLFHYDKASDGYVVHPATREILRGLLATLKVSGKQEEPLWE